MVEPLAVGVHAVNRTQANLADTDAIIGAGIIGLMTLKTAKAAGMVKIFVTDVLDYRLKTAEKMGADVTVNSKLVDPVKVIKEMTNDRGVDVVFEAVGLEATVQQAVKMARTSGKVTILGMLSKTMRLNVLDIVTKELDVKGSYAYSPDSFTRAFNIIKDHKIDVKPLITNVLPLEEVKTGFEMLHQKKHGVLKILLKP